MRYLLLLLLPFSLFAHFEDPRLLHSVDVVSGAYRESTVDYAGKQPHALGIKRIFGDEGWAFNLPHLLTKKGEGSDALYTYDKKERLKKVEKEHYGWIAFAYEKGQCHARAFDGSCISYYFDEKPYVNRVEVNGETVVEYAYHNQKVVRRKSPQEGTLLVDYYEGRENDVDGVRVTLANPKKDRRIGRVKTLRRGNGELIAKFFYNATSTVVYNAKGAKKIFYFDHGERVTCVDLFDKSGLLYKREKYEWAEHGLASKTIEDGQGNVVLARTFYYDAVGRLQEEVGEDCSRSYAYDQKGALIQVTDENGDVQELFYDDRGFLVRTQKGERFFHIERCVKEGASYGLPEVVEEWCGEELIHQATYEYDAKGRVLFDGENRFAYDAAGRLIAKNDEEYTYRDGYISSIRTPEGTKNFFHDEEGKLAAYSEEGKSAEYLYDRLGCLIAEIDANGNRIDYAYDEFCRLISRQLPAVFDENGAVIRPTTTYVYDVLDTLIEKKGYTKEWEDPVGEKRLIHCPERDVYLTEVTEREENGTVVLTTFDPLGRPEKVVRQNGCGVEISRKEIRYDAMGNRAFEMDTAYSVGGERLFCKAWKYNQEGRPLAFIEGNTRVTSYTYDEVGHLHTVTKPDGVVLTYEYDDQGRLARLSSSDGTVDDVFSYDEAGNLICAAQTKRSYDDDGHIVSEKLAHGLEVHYCRDELGRCTELTLPDGSCIAYAYEGEHLVAVHRNGYSYHYRAFDEESRVTEASLICNAGEVSYARDEEGFAIETPFFTEEGTVDASGSISHIVEGDEERCFGYDEHKHLVEEPGFVYDYDSVSNRLSKNGTEYVYDDFYQLIQVGDEVLEYDLNGNLVKKGKYRYFYDALNRLIKVEVAGGATISYTYDAFNRRLSKTVDGKTQLFFYEGQREIGSTSECGEIEELRVLGTGYGAEIGAAVAVELQGRLAIPIHDHRGCVRMLVDADTRQPIAEYHYSAFGEVEGTPSSPWGFVSKRHDPDTGLIHFGRRDFDPTLGRWVTRDPLLGLEGPNPYAYVENNPLAKLDLYGLSSFPLFWKKVGSFLANTYAALLQFRDQYAFENYYQYELTASLEFLLGDNFFYMVGYHIDPSDVGVYGQGECNDKVRLTFINGMLNGRPLFSRTIDNFSNAHGGNNIHYVFRNTEGWTNDLLKGLMTKMGYPSPHAKRLACQWRYLIAEMGGPDEGGLIIHYAHSIGGSDTAVALQMLKPEERKMIRVITIGSPCTIPYLEVEGAYNFGSWRDGVSIVNLFNHIHPILPHKYHVVFVGSFFGIPFFDHWLDMDTYTYLMRRLGAEFVHKYKKDSL